MTGAAPKQRKTISAKKRAAAVKAKTPRRSPEFERKVTLAPEAQSKLKKRTSSESHNRTQTRQDRSVPSGGARRPERGEPERKRGSRSLERGEPELELLASEMSAASEGSSRAAAEMPLVAICGRPNVGKSTLFNRLTGTRRSIVGDEPGITRDRIYGEVEWIGRTVRLVDTGGVVPDDEALIPSEIFRQAQVALGEADAIIMVVDGRTELAAPDVELARLLLRNAKVRPLFLAVNKMDAPELEAAAENFRTLGFRNVVPISAEHGSGIGDLLDEVWAVLPEPAAAEPELSMDGEEEEAEEDSGAAFADPRRARPARHARGHAAWRSGHGGRARRGGRAAGGRARCGQ